MLNYCIFIVFYTSLFFNFAYSLKEISFRDPNIQYFGHWQTTDHDIQQSGWPGAYFKVILENTFNIKLQFNSHVSIKVQLNKDNSLLSFQDTSSVELKDLPSSGPHTITVYTTDIDPPFSTSFQSIWVDDTAAILPSSTQLPLVQFVGHDLSLGIQSSENLFTSFAFLTRQSIGLEYSYMAYRNATLIDGIDHKYFEKNAATIPWSIVILLGANDDLKLKNEYQLVLENFLTKVRKFFQQYDDIPIFVLSEPLGDMFYPSQQSVLNRARHGDQHVFFIDTTAWLRYGPTYYLNPGHLTDAGHQLFAKKIAPFIQTKLSHPKDPLPGPPPNPNLPGDWQTMDVGQEDMIGLPGTVSADSSTTFTLWGSGADINNDKDGFRFVYQPFSNQGKLESTVRSHSTFAKCAKAGIMIREHLGHGSPFIMLGISPADGLFLEIRYDNFKTTKVIKKLRASPPYRLRLTRLKESQIFTAQIQLVDSSSSFDLDWETFATIPFELAHDVYAGLAVTSCDTSVVSVAKFTDVQLYHTVASIIEYPHLLNQQST